MNITNKIGVVDILWCGCKCKQKTSMFNAYVWTDAFLCSKTAEKLLQSTLLVAIRWVCGSTCSHEQLPYVVTVVSGGDNL